MATLAEINASAGPDVIIRTLEITSSAWPDPILICNGFDDQTCITEDGRTLTFTAVNVDIELASKNNKGNQTLAFALDNTTGEVSLKSDQAIEAGARVTVVYRDFLESNKSAPAARPYRLTLLSGTIKGAIAQLQCGYFNMISVAWPRRLYTANEYPGLRYIA
jgi:hypothetical protein